MAGGLAPATTRPREGGASPRVRLPLGSGTGRRAGLGPRERARGRDGVVWRDRLRAGGRRPRLCGAGRDIAASRNSAPQRPPPAQLLGFGRTGARRFGDAENGLATALLGASWVWFGGGFSASGLWRLRFRGCFRLFGSNGRTRFPQVPTIYQPSDRSGCAALMSQGFQIPADNFPNELARVSDSVGKWPAWRCLDAAFPSHFVMVAKVSNVPAVSSAVIRC